MPSICSSCGRTSGRCQSCIRADAFLTPERVEAIRNSVADDSNYVSPVDFARAISREVVGLLAREPLSHEFALRLAAMYGKNCPVYEAVEIVRAVERQHDIADHATPGASGAGQEG